MSNLTEFEKEGFSSLIEARKSTPDQQKDHSKILRNYHAVECLPVFLRQGVVFSLEVQKNGEWCQVAAGFAISETTILTHSCVMEHQSDVRVSHMGKEHRIIKFDDVVKLEGHQVACMPFPNALDFYVDTKSRSVSTSVGSYVFVISHEGRSSLWYPVPIKLQKNLEMFYSEVVAFPGSPVLDQNGTLIGIHMGSLTLEHGIYCVASEWTISAQRCMRGETFNFGQKRRFEE